VFRGFFSRKATVLTGAPPVRRMKTYSAQSGYVYQYYYEGHRPFHHAPDGGIEFVFSLSHDRKQWHSASVMVSDSAIAVWEQAHARQVSPTERYAVAKMALFQAFDERTTPEQMKEPVRLRPADVEGIIESLGL
jgi:hypothetical protein